MQTLSQYCLAKAYQQLTDDQESLCGAEYMHKSKQFKYIRINMIQTDIKENPHAFP